MSKLTIVANIRINPGQIDRVKAELLKLIPITRAEAGCLRYELQQDNQNPAHFIFVECWKSLELWQAHKNAAHLGAFGKATEGSVAEFTVNELTQVG